MYCKHCGKKIADDSQFCTFCGTMQDVEAIVSQNVASKPVLEQKQEEKPSTVQVQKSGQEEPQIENTNVNSMYGYLQVGIGIITVLLVFITFMIFRSKSENSAGMAEYYENEAKRVEEDNNAYQWNSDYGREEAENIYFLHLSMADGAKEDASKYNGYAFLFPFIILLIGGCAIYVIRIKKAKLMPEVHTTKNQTDNRAMTAHSVVYRRKSDGLLVKKGGVTNGKQMYINVATGAGMGYIDESELETVES